LTFVFSPAYNIYYVTVFLPHIKFPADFTFEISKKFGILGRICNWFFKGTLDFWLKMGIGAIKCARGVPKSYKNAQKSQ